MRAASSGSGDEVPGVGVAGHVAGGELLTAAADPDGDIAVDGLGLADSVVDLVVAALERRALLRPEGAHDLDGLAHAMHPLGGLGEVEAVHGVLGLVPSRPDAHVQPPAAYVVDGDGHLGEERGVAVAVAGDHHAAAGAPGGGGERRERGPALENGEVRAGQYRGGDVVRGPQTVEAEVVGEAPDAEELVPRRALGERFESEAEGVDGGQGWAPRGGQRPPVIISRKPSRVKPGDLQ